MRRTIGLWALALSLPLAAGCGGGQSRQSHVIAVNVTESGFVPKEVKVAVGEPITLRVTRTTASCGELVMPDTGIERELPLNEPVTIEFTPDRGGVVRYQCGDNIHFTGQVTVEEPGTGS